MAAGPVAAAWAAAAAHRGHGDDMGMMRFLDHLFTTRWHLRRAFPGTDLARITDAVARAEQIHRGQIVVAIEAALPLEFQLDGITPKQRAIITFRHLNVWDTAENNGVLIYLCLADRDVEIVADRGIHNSVGTAAWEDICRDMESLLKQKVSADAVIPAIDRIGALLAVHFPRTTSPQANELPDPPVIL